LDAQTQTYVKEQLAELPLFQSFSEEELEQIIPYFDLQAFSESTILFDEGDRCDYLCIVLEGTVDIRKESLSGNQKVAVKFGHGSVIGEMALIDQYPRSTSAKVTSNSKLLILTREKFEGFVKDSPQLGVQFLREIARILSQRLRRSSGRFSDIF
jgi:CRP-like cAMP-binding protein